MLINAFLLSEFVSLTFIHWLLCLASSSCVFGHRVKVSELVTLSYLASNHHYWCEGLKSERWVTQFDYFKSFLGIFKTTWRGTLPKQRKTRSSWLICALRDDEAVHWVSIGHYEAVAVVNWWYWVSRGHSCLYILQKVLIWKGVTHA